MGSRSIRCRCWRMPGTTSATCWDCCWRGERTTSRNGSRQTAAPTAGEVRRFWPRSRMRACCWPPSVRSGGRRSADSAPEAVPGGVVIWVAGAGVLVNTVTALLFLRGRRDDLNIQGAFLHMAADAGVSVAVVLGGWAILATGQTWIDPVLSLLVVVVILWGTWGLLRDSTNLALARGPRQDRTARRTGVPAATSRRGSDSRPAHLGDEHHGNRAHRAFSSAPRATTTTGFWRRRRPNSWSGSASTTPRCNWNGNATRNYAAKLPKDRYSIPPRGNE